uniref:Uncharacterized protein n=1 Tax=Molossus molossus TaxID=27622 RepID=A0A7J8CYQ8_MOLMO|nr:hypothetical protein HJG59_009426 [Molossus molossus]
MTTPLLSSPCPGAHTLEPHSVLHKPLSDRHLHSQTGPSFKVADGPTTSMWLALSEGSEDPDAVSSRPSPPFPHSRGPHLKQMKPLAMPQGLRRARDGAAATTGLAPLTERLLSGVSVSEGGTALPRLSALGSVATPPSRPDPSTPAGQLLLPLPGPSSSSGPSGWRGSCSERNKPARGRVLRRSQGPPHGKTPQHQRRQDPEAIKRPGPKLPEGVLSWACRRGAAAAMDLDLSLSSPLRGRRQ